MDLVRFDMVATEEPALRSRRVEVTSLLGSEGHQQQATYEDAFASIGAPGWDRRLVLLLRLVRLWTRLERSFARRTVRSKSLVVMVIGAVNRKGVSAMLIDKEKERPVTMLSSTCA